MSIQVVSTTEPVKETSTMGALASGKVEEKTSAADSKESGEIVKAEASDTSADDSKADNETEVDGDEKSDTEEKRKKKGGFKKRIDKLTTKLSAKEQEAEYWKNEAMKSQKSGAAESKAVEAKAEVNKSSEPSPEDYDSHEAYIKAVGKWSAREEFNEREAKLKESQVRDETQKSINSHVDKVRAFAAKHEDFNDLIDEIEDIPMSLTVQEVILASDNGPELMYELAKHRAEYAKICKLPPIAAARELGRFEAKFIKDADESAEKEIETKTSKAPPPIKPIGAKSSGSSKKDISDPNLSQAEYEQLRREQMKARSA